MLRFITLGNDNPKILTYNLQQLSRLYPQSEVILYDWGHKSGQLERFQTVNPRLVVRPWQAHPGDYMFQKVACIYDGYSNQPDQAMIYIDSDVVVLDTIEVFDQAEWDIGATWRPDTGVKRDEFGVGTWLNDGVVFVNNERAESSLRFLQVWVERCAAYQNQSWWIDQVELIRLFSEALPDLSIGPDRYGLLDFGDCQVRLKTLDGEIFNCLPEPYQQIGSTEFKSPKVIHLKSAWRKAKFNMSPEPLRTAWLSWIRSGYAGRPLLKRINYGFNALLRYLLAKGYWPK